MTTLLIGIPLVLAIGLLLFVLMIVVGSEPRGNGGQVEPSKSVHPPQRPAGSKPPRHPVRPR